MADFQELGLRFVPVNDAAANKALTDVAANSEKAEVASKKLTATQQSAANAQRMVAEANRLNTSALGQMAQAIQAADAAQRAALASTKNLGTAVQTAAAQAKAASVSFNTFYDAAERDFATQYVGSMNKVVGVHGKAVESSKAMTQATLNLSRQFADVGVTAAMGMSPLMILIQQGPQIADAFSMAKAQGIGFSDIMRNMKGVIGPLIPIIAGVGAVLGVVVGGFALFEREIDKNTKYATTWGDTWNATVHVVGDAIMNGPIGTGLRWLGKFFGTVMDAMVDGVTWWADKTVGHFGAAYQMIVKHWRQLPQVFGVIMQGAANISIQAIEGLINKTIQGVNYLLKAAGKSTLAMIDLPEIKLANAKLAAEYNTLAEGISSSFRKGRERFGDQIAAQTDREYLSRQKATKAVKDHTAALNELNEVLDRSQPITADMSKAVDLSETKAVKMTAAIRELNGELKQMPVYIDPAVTAMEEFYRAANQTGSGVDQMFNGLKNRDWMSAVSGLLRAAKAVQDAFAKGGTTAGKIGAVAGIADAAGQAIGGTAGGALSGAAGGAMAGFTLGGPVGAAIGSVVGGIVGIFSASSQKKAQKEAAAQAAREAEAQRQAQILQQRRQIEVAYVEATGTALEILEAQRKAELEGIDESNKAMALALYAAQDQKRRDEEGIALMRQLQAMDDAVLGTTTALTAARQEELKALDPANRYLAELIYARQDEAAAIEKGTALINAQRAYEADAQATWLRDVTNTRKDELASRKAMETAAQEAAKATAEAFQTLVEKVNASRQALLRAGDVTGAVGGDFSIGKSDLKLTDPNFNVRAIGELSLIRQRLDNLASADALNIQDVGSVIRRVFDQRYDDANVSARQDIIAGLSGGLGLVVRDAIAGLGTFLGDSQIRSRYQARGSGLASVYAASDDYNMVAQQNYIPTGIGTGINSFGADVGAYQLALAQLDGQVRKGTITQDQYGQAVDRVNEMVGASLIELANSTELQMARIEAAAEGLRQAGINSVVYYFGEITKAADALAVASKAANEPISQVTAAIGRLNSISTALGLSASAAGGGDARIDQAKLIAEAARVASQTLTTADAARIAKELAANDNFAGLSTTGLRDIAMLLDGLKAFDPNSFEASFLRLNNALITGAVTSDQYSALFAKAMDVYSGAAEDAAAQAQALAAAAETQHQLDIRLLRARGQDAAAIAIEQADELAAAANDNQRATLRMIYAEETLAKARQEASAAAQASIDKFTGLRDNLRALQVELSRGAQAALSPEAQYLANKAEFDRVSGLAATRDATALAALPDTIRQFLDASKGYFATSQGYFTDLAAAQASAAGGENAAVTALDLAQQQLNTLDLINASVLGVQDAILGLPVGPSTPTTSSAPSVVAPATDEETKQLLRELLVEVRASGIRVGAGLTALLAKGDEIVEAEEGTTRAVRAA